MALAHRRTVSRFIRLLIPAALIAVAGVLGGSATSSLATACAAPKFDLDFYKACIDQKQLLYSQGKITKPQRDDGMKECCELAGGTAVKDPDAGGWVCSRPKADAQTPPGGAPTQTLQPALPPEVDQPGGSIPR